MNYNKMLSSAAIFLLLGGAAQADFTISTKGGFVKDTQVGTTDSFGLTYVGTAETLNGSVVTYPGIDWGTSTGSGQSGLRAESFPSTTVPLNTPTDFGKLTHQNFPITGGSLIYSQVARELTITNTNTNETLTKTFTFDLWNWETPNNASPCPATWSPPDYEFGKTVNGETHHVFSQGPGDSPCYDAHDVAAIPGQDFTWVTQDSNGSDIIYNFDISGFYNSSHQLVNTFWSPEEGTSTGHMELLITELGSSTGIIGGRLWVDINNDGIQNDTPHATAIVTVQLFESTDLAKVIAQTTTDSNGYYQFTGVETTDLNGKEYVVKFIFPSNFTDRFVFTQKGAGSDDTKDSNVDANGVTDPFELHAATPTEGNLTIDAGIKFGAVAGYVWNDLDEDGIQDAGEPPFPYNVTVNLYKAGETGVYLQTQTTTDGGYLFEPLPAGTYTVEFVRKSGYLFSPKNATTDTAKDSDADESTGKSDTITVTLSSGNIDHFENVDAGMYAENPSVLFDKTTNGQDADVGSGPYIQVGQPVLWSYQVTNNGNVPLMDIKITDDKEGVIDCPQNTLGVDKSMICSKTGTAQEGWYENNATFTAIAVDEASIEMWDVSHYTGEVPPPPVNHPSLEIKKTTNGEDADTGTGPEITVGDLITWNYHVHNNGDTMMYNIVVTDDKEGTITCPLTSLNPGQHMDCTFNGVAVAGPYENTGTVTALIPDDPNNPDDKPQPFSATDMSHYTGAAVTENCPCNEVHSDSSDTMGVTTSIMMVLMTLLAGLFFVRREDHNMSNR